MKEEFNVKPICNGKDGGMAMVVTPKKGFKLSEKITKDLPNTLWISDVKKFIKLLKEEFYPDIQGPLDTNHVINTIDKLAGDDLIDKTS